MNISKRYKNKENGTKNAHAYSVIVKSLPILLHLSLKMFSWLIYFKTNSNTISFYPYNVQKL